METIKRTKIAKRILISIMTLILIVSCILAMKQIKDGNSISANQELLRAMTYEQFEDGDEKVEGTDNVEFSAFFLRDIDGDGYVEKLKGTCREIGQRDTLYMEIKVLTAGRFKDGKIQINGKNFNLAMALPRDQQIKKNAIDSNITEIEFNDLLNGTQKLMAGIISFSSINNNINNYSINDNKIILTGTYVNENGEEIDIRKEVDLQTDWYGTTRTILDTEYKYQDYYNMGNLVNESNNTIDLTFSVKTKELDKKLAIANNHIEISIPEFNGYKASNGLVTSSNTKYYYDIENNKLIIDREATVDETGNITKSVSRDNVYQIKVQYPVEAYNEMLNESVELLFPIEEYYDGFNNYNNEFVNPYRSNIVNDMVKAVYYKEIEYIPGTNISDSLSVTIGEYISSPYNNYVISKSKPMRIYNGLSTEEYNDEYNVRWYYYRGNIGENEKIILKENSADSLKKVDNFLNSVGTYTSMEEITTNRGIYFSDLSGVLEENGEIKVYDDVTGNLLITINKDNLNKYSLMYYYDKPIKHIRVEITGMKQQRSIYVYHIKELDDEYITNNYTIEEFINLKQIRTNLTATKGDVLQGQVSRNALYELPTSVAKIEISKNVISTQETEKNDLIKIKAEYDISNNEIGWTNGTFLVKIPDEILETEINEVNINNSNVVITLYEYFENEQGKFIRIYTENNNPQSYEITIDCDLTPDPRIPTINRYIELYASNEEGTDYYYKGQDQYDVNTNLNTVEMINKTTCRLSIVAPNSLLTNQTLSEFDEEGTIVISPNVADVSPVFAGVDNDERTIKIGVQLKNNYSNDISEIVILGKIPFEGNTSVLTGHDLGSSFTTRMLNTGIEVPLGLQGQVDIYYSTNENPTKDLTDENNNWKKAEDIEDWTQVRTYIIDFKDVILSPSDEYIFYYTVAIPNGLNYNVASYSQHGIWFSLETAEGKYRTQIEPTKTGIRIADKYGFELTKYQSGKEKKINNATYSITEINEDGSYGNVKTGTTFNEGKISLLGLYIEKEYEIKEIKSPEEYELNENVIHFICHINENGELIVEKLSGDTRGDFQVIRDDEENQIVTVSVEDEAKVSLKIVKTERNTETRLPRVSYKITGDGLPETGKVLKTNTNGEATITGLNVGTEYILEETKAEGYYLNEPISFTIVNNEGTYDVNINGEYKNKIITLEDEIPSVQIELEDDKIPTYNLQINKIGSITAENQTGIPVVGAKFALYKDSKLIGTYETNEQGHINIENLYQYEESRNIDQNYRLVEVYAPEGYAKKGDINFRAKKVEEQLVLEEVSVENQVTLNYTIEENKIVLIVEDPPSFRLIKKDGETNELLPNTKFVIYNVDEEETPARNSKGEIVGTKEIIDGEELYTLTTDENGQIIADLPEGLYKAVEVEADIKYDIEGKEEYFGIGKSKDRTLKIEYDIADVIANPGWAKGKKIISVEDGYIVAVESTGQDKYNIKNGGNYCGVTLIRYDNNYNIIWEKNISTYIVLYDMVEDDDGNIIILVGGTGGGTGSFDGHSLIGINIIKFDKDGNVIDLKNIDTNKIYNGKIEKDGSFAYCTYTGIKLYNSQMEYVGLIPVNWIKFNTDALYEKTSDEDYIIVGKSTLSEIEFNDNNISISEEELDGYYNAFIVKIDSTGEIKWFKIINYSLSTEINDLCALDDGSILVGGTYNARSTVGVSYYNDNNRRVFIDKYDKDGNLVFSKKQDDLFNNSNSLSSYFNKFIKVEDNNLIVSICFHGTIYMDDGKIYTNNYNSGDPNYGMVLLCCNNNMDYDDTGFIKNNTGSSKISSYCIKDDFLNLLISGNLNLTIGNNSVYASNNVGLAFSKININGDASMPEVESIIFENYRKQYKITTDVNEIDGIKGGSVSGEGNKAYEIIKYGDNSTKEIKMVPNENYEIIGITVNGEEWQYEVDEDGSYTMPQFENVTEDKHIVVTFAMKDNKIIINKENSITNEKIENVEFKLDQIEERTEPIKEEIFGELTNNSDNFYEIDLTNEITGKFGEMVSNNTYYFVQNEEGKLVPTNSKTWQVANVEGATTGVQSSYAMSYIPIDLTGLDGKYKVVVNAEVSSQSGYDYGYINIGTSTGKSYYYSNNSLIYQISGTQSAKDYVYSNVLNGGQIYYLHLGYYKNGSTDTGNDQMVINSIKLYGTNTCNYNFVDESTKYVSTNQGKADTVSNSYIPINLEGYTGKYNLIVNAEISSQLSYDYGYVTVTESTNRPSYSNSIGRFIYISGISSAKDYTTELDGGKIYYLHLGYYKNGSTDNGEDKFTVNSINITLNDSELYHTEIETNSQGQAITQIPFGKYQVTELNTPEGYWPLEEPVEIEFRSFDGAQHEFTIENEPKAKVTVHHYLKDSDGNYTETKLAEDEIMYGHIDDDYLTYPKIDLEKYELEKNEEGKIIVPNNSNGKYTREDIDVNYYYEEKMIPLVVHHYIEGTETPVPLADGTVALDEHRMGRENEEYTTEAIEDGILNENYELVSTPKNAIGSYEFDEVEVIYYYGILKENLVINKLSEDGVTPLQGAKFIITDVNEPQNIVDIGPMTSNGSYYFIESNGIYIPNNNGRHSTTANSYIRVDTTNAINNVTVKINAQVSSESGYDFGYITINESQTAPAYYNSIGRIAYVSGSGAARDYEQILQPGKVYYIHFGYRKDSSANGGSDRFTINRIEFEGADSGEVYITNEEGKIETLLEVGTYTIKEIVPPEGHELSENSTREVTLSRLSGDVEIDIINNKQRGDVITHHYIEGTTTKVPLSNGERANDERQRDLIGESYTTNPIAEENLDENYQLVSTPTNANGTFTANTQEVYYYYKKLEKNLIITKVDEDGVTPIPGVTFNLVDIVNVGEIVNDGTYYFEKQGTKLVSNNKDVDNSIAHSYVPIDTTNWMNNGYLYINYSISSQYNGDYGYIALTESTEMPQISDNTGRMATTSGVYNNYGTGTTLYPGRQYYLHFVYNKNADTSTNEDIFTINSFNVSPNSYYYTTDNEGKIYLTLKAGEYNLFENNAPKNYEIPTKPTILNVTKDMDTNITITNMKKRGTVTIHYYIEGTEIKVPSNDGGIVEDRVQTNKLEEQYVTEEANNVSEEYELVRTEGPITGIITEFPKEVFYYYKKKSDTLIIEKTDKDTGETMQDVKFKVEQEDERELPDNLINQMRAINVEEYNYNVAPYQYQMYYFYNDNGQYIPTNGKKYLRDFTNNTTAMSTISLTEKEAGRYYIKVNAEISSEENGDYGWVNYGINSLPTSSSGAFVYISGEVEATDYPSNEFEISETDTINISVGYSKNGSITSGNDEMIINSIKLVNIETNEEEDITDNLMSYYNYYFEKQNGKYVSNFTGVSNSGAYSNVQLTGMMSGKYIAYVNAASSTEEFGDYGYAALKENNPNYNSEQGRFMLLSGEKEAKNYYSPIFEYEEGGTSYHVVLGYLKNQTVNAGEDAVKINKVGLYRVIEDNTVETTDGGFVSTNQDIDNSISYGVIPLDLRNVQGKLNLNLDYEISSDGSDFGYVYISKDPLIVDTDNEEGRLLYISGIRDPKHLQAVINGGSMYYLHIGYKKDGQNRLGDDTFKVSNVNITLNSEDYYSNEELITNEEGKIEITVPYGKYKITEIETPEKYKEIEPQEFEFNVNGEHKVSIENEKKDGEVIVHHYIEGTTTKVPNKNNGVVEDVIINGKVDEQYNTLETLEKAEYYELVEEPVNKDGIITEDTIEVNYYYRLKEYNYKVNYLEKETNQVLSTQKEQTGITFGTIIDSNAEKIEINGYNFDSVDKNNLIIGTNENVINLYYTKKNDLSYTIHYKEQGSEKELATDKVVTGKTFEEKVTENAIDIVGYNKVDPTSTEITVLDGVNEFTFYYTKKSDLSYTIHYKEQGSEATLAENKVEINKSFGDKFTETAIDITGYNKVEPTSTEITVIDGVNEFTFYYTKKSDLSYTIHYKEQGSEATLAENKVEINKSFGDKFTETAIDITGYNKVEPTSTEITVIDGVNEFTFYYTKKSDLSYTIHYKEQGSEATLAENKVEINKSFGDKFTETAIDIVGYNKVNPTSTEITVLDGVNEYTFYYNRAKFNYTVEYYYDNVIDDSKTEQIESLYQEEITSYTDKVKEGYKLDKVEGVPLTISENEDKNIIKVYYVKGPSQTKTIQYIVNYYKDNVLQEADTQYQTQEVNLLSDEELVVDKSSINTTNKYEDYTFVETNPTQIPDTIKNGGVIDVYYTRNKYPYSIEYYYNNIIDAKATESGQGYKGDIIDTYTNKNKDGYEFESVDGLPLVFSSTEDNIIKVYYLPIRKITINHIDKNTNEIIKAEERTGKEGYKVKTSAEDFKGYVLLEKPKFEEYTYSENEQIVNYYYAKVSSGVIEKHIDIVSGKPIVKDTLHEGYTGKAYTTQIKNIDNYEHATNKQYYKMLLEKNPNLLSEAGVSTLEEYLESKGINENLDYIPANSKGNMTEDLIEVRYYYVPKTKLIVKYIDINTGEEIIEEQDGSMVSTTIEKDGVVDEAYSTTQKEFDDYIVISNKIYYKNYFKNHPDELKEDSIDEFMTKNNNDPNAPYTPSNSKGTMLLINNPDGTYSNETIVTYYYGKERKVVVKYYDYNTNEEISEEIVKIGPDGEPYNVEDTKKEIENYTLFEEPDTPTGIYQENNETRKYYYAKNTQVVVKYVDKVTEEELATTKTIDGYVGKGYITEKEDIDGYNYISSTNNTSGKMTEDILEVVYYYSKPKEKTYSKYTINYIDADTGKPIKESKEIDKQEVETKIYTKSLVIDIDDYTFKNANTDYFVIKDNENTIINLYYSKNETLKEKEPTVVNIKIKDNTPSNNVKDTTNVKDTNNEKPTKNQVRVSNTGKTSYIPTILGTAFIIIGCLLIVANKIHNQKRKE